jgi:hypothetical protein
MALKQYVIKHDMFAKAMLSVDPAIALPGTCATPDEMRLSAQTCTSSRSADKHNFSDWRDGCKDRIEGLS